MANIPNCNLNHDGTHPLLLSFLSNTEETEYLILIHTFGMCFYSLD